MKRRCFVLMPFADDLREVYDHAIVPAAEATDFDCFRADDAFGPTAIISDIIESIFTADVIVADLTRSNPNVFYELGVAHTVGNKTIMICDAATQRLPFDLQSYRVILYQKTIDGIRERLRNELERTLQHFPVWSAHHTNPVQNFRPIIYAVPLVEQARLEKEIDDLKGLREEKRRGELRAVILSLPESEITHLHNLFSPEPFFYQRHDAFLRELRRLKTLGLIREKTNTPINGIPYSGDLHTYLELTDLARDVLAGFFKLFIRP